MLFKEMKGRIKEDDSTVPAPDGDWAYFVSYVTGGQHPLFCREPSAGGEKRVLLDGNKLAEGLAYFQIGGASHSHDHRLLGVWRRRQRIGILHAEVPGSAIG